MSALRAHHLALGAALAADGIPLHYGNQPAEYQAALKGAALFDRSHEGRALLAGESRYEFVNRMSTNNLLGMAAGEGRATLFVKANARILFRVMAYNLPEGLLLIGEPGQGAALLNLLRRNIFFGDKIQARDLTADTAQFAIHGPEADRVLESLSPGLADLPRLHSAEIALDGGSAIAARDKAISGSHWRILCPVATALAVHRQLLMHGASLDLKPAGSLTYHALRVRGGRPAGLELSSDYIPLEVGLWDEISFDKGCYTGQEIIARMESRQRLAKTLVKLQLARFVEAPTLVYAANRVVGKLTSSALAPTGEVFSLAVLKLDQARPGTNLLVGEGKIAAVALDYAGAQPPFITN